MSKKSLHDVAKSSIGEICKKSIGEVSKKSLSDIVDALYRISLKKFCIRKLLEIEVAIPLTSQNRTVLTEIIETGKKHEHLSNTFFITYEDVIGFIERLIDKESNVDLPERIKEYAQEVVATRFQVFDSSSLNFLALMTKLKIVECMYTIYCTEVTKMQRRRQVNEELTGLFKDCELKGTARKTATKGKKEEDKSTKKSRRSESNVKISRSESITQLGPSIGSLKKQSKSQVFIDDLEIILEDNELIFDYNVDNHVLYFVLSGFPDLVLLEELAKVQVNVSAIIEVSSHLSNLEEFDNNIEKLHELFETPKKAEFLENTVLMKYRTEAESFPKHQLETFLNVVRKINYIKRQHFFYIKDLKLYTFGKSPKMLESKCLEKYNKILNSYPLELINVPLIVNALVQEICWRETGSIYSLSDLTPSSESEEVFRGNPKSYQTHEEDFLKMGMRSYGEIGRKCYEQSLGYLKLLQPLCKFDHFSNIHFQTGAVSTEDSCYCDNQEDLIDYFHLALFNQMKRNQFIPKEPNEFYFTKYLVIHDQAKMYQKEVPKNYITYPENEDDLVQVYHMKENLSTAVLRQLIFKAMNEYSCWDRMYCNETDAVLLRFHDNLDHFGLETKIWWQNLRTPVCLRDFCRYIVNEEKQWLEEHKLVEHEFLIDDDEEEECTGLKDIHISETYKEYEYLLETETNEISNENKKKIFDQVMSELFNYPTSEFLTSFCNENGFFFSYDLGPKICQLTGHTTIFHSDDGVKVTIDTSRFLAQDPKCAVTVDASGNSFIFHSTSPSGFRFICKDETIVSFTKLETGIKGVPSFTATHVEVTEDEQSKETQLKEERQPESEVPQKPNYNDYWIEVLRKSNINTFPNLRESIYDKKVELDNKNLCRLLNLFKAAVFVHQPIYKISTKPSLRHLKRTTSPVHLPLVGTLKRVLFKRIHKKRKIGGYSVLNISRKKKKVPLNYDFKITLPNGLVISTLPRNKTLTEVKQEHKYKHYKEQYRILYSNGIVVIKNFDGTLTILRSNGDIIKLADRTECLSVNCAKDTTQLFQNEEKKFCPYQTTRCNQTTKPVTTPDLFEFGNVPYNKKSLLQYDGKKIDISENKITERQLYYVISEHDYHAEEVFFEREDGMKGIVDKKGTQIFQFPDGTKITAYPEIEKQLIHISNNPKIEGWVSVVINYEYEHPHYLTVRYDNTEGSTQICLRDAVIKNTSDSLVMSVEKDLALQVTSSSIMFLKTCLSCEGDCVCKIHLDEGPKLLEVYDSYGKYVSCDHFGKCEIDPNFIKSSVNKNKCNHRWVNENKKFFILNERGLPGTLLWKDSSIQNKIYTFKNSKDVKTLNYMNKLTKKQTLEFLTKIYQDFTGRFTTTQLYDRNICLSKYKTVSAAQKPRICYVTYRVLMEFQNVAEHPEIIGELKQFFEQRLQHSSSAIKEGVERLLTTLSNVDNFKEEKLSYRLSATKVSETGSSSSSSKSETDKVNVQEIIAKWKKNCDKYKSLIRNQQFPFYFHSDYYHHLVNASSD